MSEMANESGRLSAGSVMPDFTYDTPFAKGRTLSEAMEGKSTALLFLRYYGCTACQIDIQLFADEYDKIKETGGQLKIVLQSDPALVAEELGGPDAIPFEIVCDPDQSLYKMFNIRAAASKEELIGEESDGVRAKIEAKKAAVGKEFTHGKYEGEELQLPACFVLAPDRTVRWAHYGKNLADIPDPDQVVELLGQK